MFSTVFYLQGYLAHKIFAGSTWPGLPLRISKKIESRHVSKQKWNLFLTLGNSGIFAGSTWPGFASKMSALRLATIAITVSKQV